MNKKEISSIKAVLDNSTIMSILIISLLASLLSLTIPITAQILINIIAFGKLFRPVLTLSAIVFIFMVAVGALNIWQIIIVEVIQQKKQKLVMDFRQKTQHPERMTMEVLKDMVKKDPQILSQAARKWLK